MSKTAHILAVDAGPAHSRMSQGFHPMSEDNLLGVLDRAGAFVGPRPLLENDERFRQIIPYVVVKQGPDFLGYVRGDGGGEARLHGKIAIGVGGHIDLPDVVAQADGSIDLRGTLVAAASRELGEEIRFTKHANGHDWPLAIPDARWVGLLVCNDTPVDRVHIGVVGVVETDCEIHSREADAVTQLDSFSADALKQNEARCENWTRLLLPHLNHL